MLPAALLLSSVVARAAFAGYDDDLVDETEVSASRVQPNVRDGGAGLIDVMFFRLDMEQPPLNSMLEAKVHEVARRAGLSPVQIRKLMLAGEGDIRRFHERLDQLKAKYQAVRLDRNSAARMARDTQPIQAARRGGLFEEDSLFAKTLANTLSPEQTDRYQKWWPHWRESQYGAPRRHDAGKWQARVEEKRSGLKSAGK